MGRFTVRKIGNEEKKGGGAFYPFQSLFYTFQQCWAWYANIINLRPHYAFVNEGKGRTSFSPCIAHFYTK